MLLFVLLFALFCCSESANASSAAVRFEAVTITDGLSQNTVFSIYQDRQGFIWFGTADGLNRYDGYQFKHFRNISHGGSDDDHRSLSSNLVSVIYEDLSGTLWIGTEGGGLQRYDKLSQSFERFSHDPLNPASLSHDYVTAITEDAKGRLWVATLGGGINLFDPVNNQFEQIRHQANQTNQACLSDDNVRSLIITQDGMVWIGTQGGGLNRYDPNSKQFLHFAHQPGVPASLSNDQVFALYEDSRGGLWVGTDGGLSRLDRSTGMFDIYQHQNDDPYSLAHNNVRTIIEDDTGNLWIGTYGGGLDQFLFQQQQFLHHRHQASDPYSLSNDLVLSTFFDANGLLWVGTWAGGANKVDLSLRRFGHYQHNLSEPGSLSHSDVTAIYQDSKGNLWVGTRGGGLNRQRPGELGYRHYRHDPQDGNSLSSDVVRALFEDDLGNLWIATFGGGLNRYDYQTEKFIAYVNDPNNPKSLSFNNVQSVLQDSEGTLWVGTWGGGLNRFNLNSGEFERFRHNPANPNSLSDDDVEMIFEDDAGNLWIGTWGGGLNRFDRKSETFQVYRHHPTDANSLSNDNIISIFQDHHRRFWVGTYGGGLNLMDRQTGKFRWYQERHGLANNAIYGILEDDYDNLWLSTNRGLSQFNPQTDSFRNFSMEDGLQSFEYNIGAYLRAANGELLFGGVNGLNRFNPADILTQSNPPKVVFTDFLLFNQSVSIRNSAGASGEFLLPQAIDSLSALQLNHRQSLVSFEFAALDYRSPNKNQYVYKLEGLDKDWIRTDAKIRRATYTNLPAGDYTLRVKASNADQVWDHKGIMIKLAVSPPPWLSWWALCGYSLLVLMLGYGFVRGQRNKLQQAEALSNQLTKINQLKDEFLANTSHELRTPLNGIIGLTESLIDGATGPLPENTRINLAMVVASARRLSNLVNDILDFSKLQNRHIEVNAKAVDLHSMVEVVLALSRPIVGDKTLVLENAIAEDFPSVYADEDRVQQIFHNLIGNAIKFTHSGKVIVSAKLADTMIAISVKDTGIGIAKDQYDSIFESFEQVHGSDERLYSGTGLGLTVSKQLVELHGGTITLESALEQGSTFTFTLPLSKEKAQTIGSQNQLLNRLSEVNAAPQLPLEHHSDNSKFRLLIVDDEQVNRQVLLNHLSMQNYHLTEAANGQQALDAIAQQPPFDLVLLDIMMPRMSGYQVCRAIRAEHPMSELPVIFLTAKNQVADLVESFAVGANDYLSKPVNKFELLSRVETHLRLLDINRNLEQLVAKRSNELVHVEKMASLGTLTAGIAHEINNPINFVQVSGQNLAVDLQSCLQFILELAGEKADPAVIYSLQQQFQPLHEHLDTIKLGTDRIMSIVKDLRTFTQLDAEDKNVVDLRTCLQATINLVQAQKQRAIHFITQFKTIPPIPCYPAQLNQVFMNLIVNACDAIEQRQHKGDNRLGEITVGCRLSEQYIEITIEDNGSGMTEQTCSKLFEPFYTTKMVGKGQGLGLSIAYGIIEKHYGSLTFTTTLGEGSVFTVKLPMNG